MEFKELQEKILEWADSHDLLHEENSGKQFLKFVEEVFEFKTEMDMYMKSSKLNLKMLWPDTDMKLEMGDVFVTLIILCKQLEIEPMECLELAYKKIKYRHGKTIDGTFVKEEDLPGRVE